MVEETMATIKFKDKDADILYCIPDAGGDVLRTLDIYHFINRTAPPPFESFVESMTRSLAAGIIEDVGGKFVPTAEWYQFIHAADKSSANEIDSLIDFEARLLSCEWEVRNTTVYQFDEADYMRAAYAVNSRGPRRYL
jgi:hypothetical protein